MDVNTIVQLKPEEDVLEVVREHLAPHLPKFILIAIWFLVPFFFMFPMMREGIFGTIFFFVLVGSAAIVGLRSYMKWKNTVLIVTDRRIIDVEQKGLFDRVVSEVPYKLVDDVSYRKKGIVSTIFRFGMLTVRTTGNAADIEFQRVAVPKRLHDLIGDLRETVLDERKERKKKRIKKMAKSMSMDEIKQLAREVRKKEQQKAMNNFYQDDEQG